MLYFGLFYGLSTIILFIFPQIYFSFVDPLFFGTGMARHVRNGYAVGFSQNFSTTAIYLSTTISISMIPLLRKEQYEKKELRMYLILSMMIYVSILLTGKRAHSVFVLLCGIITYWIINKDKKISRLFYVVGAISILLTVFFIASQYYTPLNNVVKRFESKVNKDNLLSGRDILIFECINMFKENPIIGTGWGSYTYYTLSGLWDAHNVYIQLLAENGILLSIPFYLFFIINYAHTIKAITKNVSFGNRSIFNRNGLLGSSFFLQTFFLLYCFTGNPLYDVQMFIPYVFSCAIGERYYRLTFFKRHHN